MRSISLLLLVGFLLAAHFAAGDEPTAQANKRADTQHPGFLDAFQGIKKEVDTDLQRLYATVRKELNTSETERQREAVQMRQARESHRILLPAAEKVMTAVRPYASDPAAVDALEWIIKSTPGSDFSNEAAGVLAKHHLTDKRTVKLARRCSPFHESLLRAQLAAANLPEADRPHVLLALAQLKQTHSQLPQTFSQMSDDQLSLLESIYGEAVVKTLRTVDVAKAETAAISLYREMGEEYGSVKWVNGLTFGDAAKSGVFEIQNLSVGKTAPEISAEDIDGVKFKLSDYRGKVVMLTFWATWCGPCMARVPHERELVERLKDKPFVLIGVNADGDKAKLRVKMDKAQITWRSFWCGEEAHFGDIPKAWNVHAWPTIYILDHRGIIRGKMVFGEALDRVIDKLVSEVEVKR